MNRKLKLPCNFFKQFIGEGVSKKILVYPATKLGGDDYDPYEDNFTFTNLNPITVNGFVRTILPETAYWKQYGQHIDGAKEISCSARWKDLFINANKITIDNIDYQVFKDSGKKLLITDRPLNTIRIILSRLE